VAAPTPEDIVAALRRGPATPDALAARLREADRDAMWWAVGEAIRLGLVASSADFATCEADGLCGASVPTVLSLTERRRA
jgi:hypothetical protein